MDHDRHSGTPSSHTSFGGSVLEQQEQPLSSSHCQTESEGSILLHLLEFKSHLLEVVEELHIRRDAESRFEDQISKLVLEKQELEWEKESLQNQMEMEMKQHTEALTTVKKQFQAKLQSIEEEKGKYQVTAELKDKEINNLKEELKSLQLLKYNLEKKSSELEQKLALKSRTKDTHVHQLGEVEKRFSALSRQCAVAKQAHEKLEQNADEAMRINRKLTCANQKQEATIASLKKELDEFRNKLIKVKMTPVRHDKSHSPTSREQHVQELRQKLHMETEMCKKLEGENATERAEKQELMRSLQHAQQLLLSQTQTVGRAEQELRVQREMFQALQHKHEVMREKGKAMEDEVAQLMEDHAASKTSWDKEKTMLLHQIKSKQEDLEAMKEAYEDLHQRRIELSLQAKPQAHHANEQETQVEDVRGGKSLHEPISSSEQSGLSDLQHSKMSEHQHATGAATREGGGEDTANHSQHSQKTEHVLNRTNAFSGSLESANQSNHCDDSRLPSETNMADQILNSSDMSESGHSIGSGFIEVHDGLLSKVSRASDTTAASNPQHGSLDGCAGLKLIESDSKGNREMIESKQGGNNDGKQQNIRAQEENTSEQKDRGDFQEHVEDGKDAGVETADGTDTREDILWLTKETGETINHETETKDRADGEVTYGVEERGQKAEHTSENSETQIPAQTSTDITEESFTLRVSDCVDTELPLTVCKPSDFSQLLSQKFAEHAEIDKEVCSDKHQSVSQGTNFDIQDIQSQCPHDVQTVCQDAEPDSHQSSAVGLTFLKPTDEKTSKEAADFPAESSEILKQLSACASQMYDRSVTGQSVCSTDVHDWKTGQAQTEMCNLPDITASVRLDAPQPLSQCKETAVEGREGPGSVVDREEDGGCENEEGQSDANTCDTGQTTAASSCFKEVTMEAALLKPETRHRQSVKSDKPVTGKDENSESSEAGSSECHEQEVGAMKLHDSSESPQTGKNTYSSLLEWRKALSSRANMDLSTPDQLTQGMSITTGPAKIKATQSSTISSFIQTKHSKAPLVITRASDLLKASSVSGAAASSRRRQRGEREGKEEICREAKAEDTASPHEDRKTSPPIASFPVSSISSTGSKLLWQTPWYSRAPTSSAGPRLEGNWERSWSQENEGEQSSFRGQISKIEQFLNTDRLRLLKRRRTDN